MGSWGSGAFENDRGLDFLSGLINEQEIKKAIEEHAKYSYRNSYQEIRIAAKVLLPIMDQTILLEQSTINGMIAILEDLIEDRDWYDSWNSKKDAKDTIKDVKSLIKKLKLKKGY